MNKPRLLIPLSIQFCVRYLLRTGLLRYIAEYAQPIVLMAWEDKGLQQELENVGAEVFPLPEARFGVQHERLRRQINLWYLHQLKSPSTAIDERRNSLERPTSIRLRRFIGDTYYYAKLAFPGVVERLQEEENRIIIEDTNFAAFQHLLEKLSADAIFSLTPFLRAEELLLRAAEHRELPRCTAILSFDNITTRGWIPVTFDCYLLWNQYNAAELHRAYPKTIDKKVVIVGSPQFDFYWDSSYLWTEEEWRSRLALPRGRPIILFGAGVRQIVPQEPLFLEQIDQAIDAGQLPGKPLILFRPHPNDSLQRWSSVLQRAKHVVCDLPWADGPEMGKTNITRTDIERLASTLRHSQAHVNTSSTMTVDGAIFDRPQIGPAYDDRHRRKYDRSTRELYLREHYRPITNSGGLALTYNREQLIEAVCSSLQEPEKLQSGRKRIVREICTYEDGKSTERVAWSIRKFLHKDSLPSEAVSFSLAVA